MIQINYLATFYTHYGAMRFYKHCQKESVPSKMTPVPRELSSSCGVCVRFEADCEPIVEQHEDMERCYSIEADGAYTPSKG